MPRSTPDPACLLPVSGTGLSPSLDGLPMPFPCIPQSLRQSIPRHMNMAVWAPPISLAATLGINFCFLFLRLLRCFSSPGSPRIPIRFPFFSIRYVRFTYVGSPIQKSADHSVCATPRSFSQLITSFFGSQCQGIRPVPFFA